MDSSTVGKADTEQGSDGDECGEEVGYDEVDLNSDVSPETPQPPPTSNTPAATSCSTGTASVKNKNDENGGDGDTRVEQTDPTVEKGSTDQPAVNEEASGGDSVVTPPSEIAGSRTTPEESNANVEGGDSEKDEEAGRRLAQLMSSDQERIAAAVASETPDETFARLKKGILDDSISSKEVVNSVFQVLVGGPFDMENKFIIQEPTSIVRMVELLDACSSKLQAEMWSVFVGIVRKSNKNLESCASVDLIGMILVRLPAVDDIVADLFIELLGVLASYSVDVKEMKQFLRCLEAREGRWPRHSAKLLYVLKQMPKKEGPDIFFSFSGAKKAGIQVPPLSKWPYQNGWTFCTWLRMDPMNTGMFEREMPYLYSFRTSKVLGYSCHFVGNCLVLTAVKTKAGKGYQLCVKYELQPRKWHHVALVHVYSRWGKNEVQCYIDGQHISTLDMNWHIGGNDHFDRCYIGYSPEDDRLSSFCGQLGAVYLFAETLNLQQINSIYCLGPGYQSCFKFDNETDIPAGYLKYLFDGRLASSIVFAYCPKNCDRQLCLESSPKDNPSYFVHTPHALMMEGVNVVVTHSVHATLHSVGGIQVLLPLFGQLDSPHERANGNEAVDYTICSTLLSVIAQLLESSPSVQQQLLQTKGFLVIGNMLLKASKEHISDRVLEIFLEMASYLLASPTGGPLLKLLVDHILINPGLWIHTAPKLQLRLYNYLSSEFVGNAQFYGTVRRVSTVMQMLHALKYYYWLVDPRNKSGYQPKGLDGPRPNTQEIVKIRSCLLLFIQKLVMKGDGGLKEDELQALLNYVTTVHEDDNLYDVLESLITLMSDDPAAMVPAFDKKKGICAVFKLMASPNELVRLPALKLLGYFLCRSTSKRKQDVMAPSNLFTLLIERLLLHASYITLATYNVLFEMLVENMGTEIMYGKHPEPESFYRFENPMILKVIANLISQSKPCPEVMEVKKVFLNDIIALCANSRENRRTILQMSVWQEWLISLAHIFPKSDEEKAITSLVCQTFCMLLHHAIKLEYGGWRVWVDTLAIVHSKVSFEKFKIDVMESEQTGDRDRRRSGIRSPATAVAVGEDDGAKGKEENGVECEVNKVVSSMVDTVCDEVKGEASDDQQNKHVAKRESIGSGKSAKRQEFRPSATPKPVYRTPEFRWSHIHIKLLSDLLLLIESDVSVWKNNANKNVIDFVNSSENAVFVVNTVHMISQIVDNLIMACGGLLPLLAAATSPNSELEIADTTQQNLRIEIAVLFLMRFANLCDVMVFATALNFSELEQEKNMPAGGILRQCLRLVATVAVRNCLAAKAKTDAVGSFINTPRNEHNQAKEKAIKALINGVIDEEMQNDIVKQCMEVQDPEQLLQEVDLNRLKAVVYRDIEETRQAQFLALGVVYFLSVLMVSRYRDILEPPPSPSPFFGTSKVLPSAEVVSAGRLSVEAANGVMDEAKRASMADGRSTCSVESGASKESGVGSREQSIQGDSSEKKTNSDATSNNATSENDVTNRTEDGRPDREPSGAPISSIQLEKSGDGESPAVTATGDKYKPEALKIEAVNVDIPRERQATLTAKLKKALESTAPLLREIMTDFHSFLQRTLLGTHGQEIMNDAKVLTTLRNQQGSVVELVMLLCSQEWQTSLQKHAGLAFIELVNEGRLLAHATRDHIVRVANEADFILNRLRAEDVAKHAEFETVCAQTALTRKEEEKTCDLLITAARRRDNIVATRVNDKILNILCSEHGAWSGYTKRQVYWKLDVWEDDSRRRKRMVPNIYGSSHPKATLASSVEPGTGEQETEKDRDVLSTHLAGKSIVPPSSVAVPSTDELVDDIDISKAAAEEKEMESEVNETANFTAICKLIAPGLAIPGLMSITSNEMFFDCNEDDPEFRQQDHRVIRYCETLHGRWHFNEIRAIFLRRYMLQNVALEIFLAARTAVMFAFPDHATVKKVVQFLPRVGVGVKYGLPQSRRASLMSPRQLFKHSEMPQKWQRREISNFDYLMFLNTISGRTYNDLNQYPVFPWILSNYDAEELDLKQAANFRDLSKPIGALNDVRHAYFIERYNSWEHEKIPPFHYGTHYSTAAFVLHWLIRVEPFTTMFLNLQGNKFDAADRTFHAVNESWRSCLRDTHDVKELIPEFFYLPELFVNINEYRFGARDDGASVGDIMLPKWAKSPEHFVAVHRQALESDLVSCQLNQWIDLIFGYKQRGPEAVRATNVFYYLTYEGAVDLNSLQDPVMKQAFENQIKNFGQTPAQLLTEPHPPRQSVMTISPLMFQPVAEDLCMVMKFISNSPVVHLSANTYPQLPNPTVVSVTASLGYSLNRWNNSYTGPVVTPSFTPAVSEKNESQAGQVPNLPLTVDPLLASGNPSVPVSRRHLGDMFDQRLQVKWNNFVTTVDSKFIIACGYPDNSIRVIETDAARVRQVVYGHKEVVTCMARSECNLSSDCYVASGSRDCTVLLWHWSARSQTLAGETGTAGETATPRAVLTGHDTEIVCIVVSAEHGLVISCSEDGPVLIHTTSGDLLRCLEAPDSGLKSPRILLMSRDCYLVSCYGRGSLCVFTTSGRAMKFVHTDQNIGCLCITRDGEYVVAAGDSGVVSVYRLFDLAHLYSYQPCDGAVKSLALAQNHRFILAGLSSGAIVVFNVDFNKWHHEYQQRYSKL